MSKRVEGNNGKEPPIGIYKPHFYTCETIYFMLCISLKISGICKGWPMRRA